MPYEQRDNSGSLFRNEKKTEPKHPDYKGDAMIDGQEMWLSAWLKDKKDGTKFMSLSFNPKEAGGNKPSSKPNATSVESDAPF